MKSLSVAICLMVFLLFGGSAFAANNDDMLPLFKEMVAEDKTQFGIDVKKCLLECQRVYSEKHCIDKCAEITSELSPRSRS